MISNQQMEGANATEKQQFLSFQLGAEEYGIDILRVQEIRAYEKATRIPNTPEFIKGVINLRGVIVPVVDLRMKFGLETSHALAAELARELAGEPSATPAESLPRAGARRRTTGPGVLLDALWSGE